MRHETCLNCKVTGGLDPDLVAVTAVTESLSRRTHHHHAMTCETCGAWWFEDVVADRLGIPVPARRDTVLCDCPEDEQHLYTRALVTIPAPEADCRCTAADVNSRAVVIPRGAASP